SIDAHIVNPCGHTICAPCGFKWLYIEGSDVCPICRKRTNVLRPFIRNYTVDHFVERYIQICALSGDIDWQVDGKKYQQWNDRNRFIIMIIESCY
ncbi:uncharacterized protein C8R40DRAFT_1037615, partial [Lentinula edodes]|uniref:uncharacterized protein n=1 Tax=Lentinula edodes TaxID=5353 RepID=UPI001E8CA177